MSRMLRIAGVVLAVLAFVLAVATLVLLVVAAFDTEPMEPGRSTTTLSDYFMASGVVFIGAAVSGFAAFVAFVWAGDGDE